MGAQTAGRAVPNVIMIDIRPYSGEHAEAAADLFHASVHAIEPSIYSTLQQEAWAPTPPDREQWRARLAETRPWLALAGDDLVGFMELSVDGHIGCAYTHPDWQGRGVAAALLYRVEGVASARGMPSLRVEASIVARPFFEQRGFLVLHENAAERGGEVLVNHTMEKRLRADGA